MINHRYYTSHMTRTIRSNRKHFAAALSFIFFSIFIPGLPAEEPVRIGASLSFSGVYREPSHMIMKGYQLWEKNINERGGLLGRPVELIILDDRSDVNKLRDNYKRLLDEEDVDLVLAPYSSPLTLAASEITEEAGFIMVTSGAASSVIWQRGYKYILSVYAQADRFFIGYLDLIARNGIRKVAIFFEDNSFNQAAAAGAREWADKMGVEVTAYTGYAPGEKHPAQIIEDADPTPEEAVIVCSYPDEGYKFLAAIRKRKIQPASIAMTITPTHPLFALRVGPLAQGVFAPSQWEPMERIPYPGTRDFIEEFRTFAHMDPSYHASLAYASCQVLEFAVTETGTLDNSMLRDYIFSMDTVTIIGRFKVNQKGEQVGHNPILIQWQNGKKEIVYPSNMKTSDPVFE